MPSTPGGLRFPAASDTPDVPRDMENLATDVESALSNKIDTSDAVARSVLTAKGSVFAASGTSVVSELPVGLDGQVLVADSSTPTGLVWSSVDVDPIPLILALS